MSVDDPFPKTFSEVAKFSLERRQIECKKALKDIAVALAEPHFAHLHETLRDHSKHFERELERLARAIPYVLQRRDRERR